MKRMANPLLAILLAPAFILSAEAKGTETAGFRFEISVAPDLRSEPVDGRIILIVSTSNEQEPRFQRMRSLSTPLVFGVDVEGLPPASPAVIDAASRGFPL
jgi:hypothetical protein